MDQVKRALFFENLRVRTAVLTAPEAKLRRCAAQTQTAQYYLRQPDGKRRRHDQRVDRREWLQTEHRMHEQWKHRRIPQLRRVGVRIRAWSRAITARVAANT